MQKDPESGDDLQDKYSWQKIFSPAWYLRTNGNNHSGFQMGDLEEMVKRNFPKDGSSQGVSDVGRLNLSTWANQWRGHLHPKMLPSRKLWGIFRRYRWVLGSHKAGLKTMESKYSAQHKLAERTVKNPVPEEVVNKGKKLHVEKRKLILCEHFVVLFY